MNKSKKICKLRDELQLGYLITCWTTNRFQQSVTRNILSQTHRIPMMRNLQDTLRRETKELTYE